MSSGTKSPPAVVSTPMIVVDMLISGNEHDMYSWTKSPPAVVSTTMIVVDTLISVDERTSVVLS